MTSEWKDGVAALGGRKISGDGFSIIISSYHGLRYLSERRVLTLHTEWVDDTHIFGRKWFVFRTITGVVQIPTCLQWDDGENIDEVERSRIARNIEGALARDHRGKWKVDLSPAAKETNRNIEPQ